jgi:hypothetical protein
MKMMQNVEIGGFTQGVTSFNKPTGEEFTRVAVFNYMPRALKF